MTSKFHLVDLAGSERSKEKIIWGSINFVGDQLISEANSFKYLGIIIRSDLTGQIM
jgi:hypothetical protein